LQAVAFSSQLTTAIASSNGDIGDVAVVIREILIVRVETGILSGAAALKIRAERHVWGMWRKVDLGLRWSV
jgi:hypothetical protein